MSDIGESAIVFSDVDQPNQYVGTLENSANEPEGSNLSPHPEEPIFRSIMLAYFRECIVIMALLLTTYASIQNSGPLVSPVPNAAPLFSKGSLVTDFSRGYLAAPMELIGMSEASLIVYYAPWDAASQHSVGFIEEAAQILHEQVTFIAINCWLPGTECRDNYATSKVQSWPVLMVRICNTMLHYQGPSESAALVRFLRTAMRPLTRITTSEELLDLVIKYDAVVVGSVDFSLTHSGYPTLYQAALTWLEREPLHELAFAVVTGSTARDLGILSVPSVRLYLWNETLEFPTDSVATPDTIVRWISSSVHQVAMWLTPPGTKAKTISPYLKQGPVLILFTPRNKYRDAADPFNLLKKLGLQYYNCNDNPWVSELSQYVEAQRVANKVNHAKLTETCRKLKPVIASNPDLPLSVTLSQWLNSSHHVQNFDTCPTTDKIGGKCFDSYISKGGLLDAYENSKNNYNTKFERHSIRKKRFIEEDHRSAQGLQRVELTMQCSLLRAADDIYNAVFVPLDQENTENIPDISGLACRTNKTLSLLAIDSDYNHYFAERLGSDVLSEENKTVVVIVDQEREYQHISREPVLESSIKRLIWDESRNFLDRSLKDSGVQGSYTHEYPLFTRDSQKRILSNQQNTNDDFEIKDKGSVDVKEITSKSFKSAVSDSNATVVLMYYSPYCAFCQPGFLMFLTVSRLLKDVSNLTFARFNMDNNDLPWEMTMDELPTIIVFPESKSESLAFPSSVRLTVPTLLSFVLSTLRGPTRLQAMVSVCMSRQHSNCWLEVQRETWRLIGFSLKQWRIAQVLLKSQLIKRLRLLKTLSNILLGYPLTNHKDIIHVHSIVKKLDRVWLFEKKMYRYS